MKGRINAQEGREQLQCAGKPAIPPDENSDFTLGVESQIWPQAGSYRVRCQTFNRKNLLRKLAPGLTC
jgi:hypothetical protein